MTRDEELLKVDEYIEKNGVTLLPKDERGPDFIAFSAWARPKKKRGRKKKQENA